jgi:hypothetical protein
VLSSYHQNALLLLLLLLLRVGWSSGCVTAS